MDAKLIDTILPKLMELLKTMKVPTEICDKIESLIKGSPSDEESPEEDATETPEDEAKEDASESECCTCPKCGYNLTPADMKPMDSKKDSKMPMGKKAVAVDVTVIKDKKNPLRDLMSRTGF